MDTLILTWPDTLLVGLWLLGSEPPVEARATPSGIVLKIEPGETVRVFVKKFEGASWRLYPLVEDTSPRPRESQEPSILKGAKSVSVSVGSDGLQINDLTSIKVEGKVYGVRVEGFLEESGFSGSEFTAELEELDRAELRATKGQLGFSLGNLREEVLGSHLKFMGARVFSSWGEAWAGYEPGSFKALEFSGERGQGPYFLVEEGETVVPGSERVFLNGKPLSPDQYQLDPFSGTLTFEPEVLVRPDDRVVVEFQVSRGGVRRYFSAARARAGAFWVEGAEVYERSEGFPGADTLRGPGWVSGARFVGEGKGSYELENGVFVFVGRGNGSWEVSFSWVGQGQGSYEYNSVLGGYQFVGEGQGSWEPVVRAWPPVEERHGGLGYQRGAISAFVRGSQRNPNRLGNFGWERGFWAGGSWAPRWGPWSLSLRAEARSELYRAFGRGFEGDEARRWGVADSGTGAKTLAEARLGFQGFYGELGFFKLREFETAAWGLGHEGPIFLKYRQTQRGFLRIEGGIEGERGRLGAVRERRDSSRLWLADGFLSLGKFGLGGMLKKEGEALGGAAQAGARLSGLEGSYQFRWDTGRVEHHLKAQARWRGFWLAPEVRVYGDYLREERFVWVGDGLGDYSYDPETGQFYPDPGGAYVRQIVYLKPGQVAVERSLEGGGSWRGISGSGWWRARPDLREEGFGLWAKGLSASWNRSQDQFRRWTQGNAKLWLPGRAEPFVQGLLRDGPLFGAAELRAGITWEGAGPAAGRVWLWPRGRLWELGAVANSQWTAGRGVVTLSGEVFWRWGEGGPGASEALYPLGLGYWLSASARWRAVSASAYLRGKGASLQRKRLSFGLSVEF